MRNHPWIKMIMTKKHLIIATRESPLALCQADIIKTLLQRIHPHLSIEFLGITTKADKMLEIALTTIGGKGLFVKELEEALLENRADLAVHSMKDVPMTLPSQLCLPVISKRENPRDVFISHHYETLDDLPTGAIVGTSSLRRQTQLHHLRPDLILKNLRGNIQTRLNKLDQGDFDAIILAEAGLIRMGLEKKIRFTFPPEVLLPAAGQGALGIECRAEDEQTRALIAPLNDGTTQACVEAERSFCRQLGGGCQSPVAAYAEHQHGKIRLRGLVANPEGTIFLRTEKIGNASSPETIGLAAAEDLLHQGAKALLKDVL